MSLLSVLGSVSRHIPEQFIAPIPQVNSVVVFSLQSNIPYRFALSNPQPGWWNIVPRSKTDAEIDDPVIPYERLDYLDQLPRYYVIAIAPVNRTTWLCTPYNLADASQRGWKYGEPKNVFLIQGNIQPFDVIVARKLDKILLFETVNTRIFTETRVCQENAENLQFVPKLRSFAHAFAIVQNILEQQRQQRLEQERLQRERERLQAIEERRVNIVEQAKWQIEFAGAELLDFRELGRGYEVTWRYDGAEFTVNTMDNLQIESAGICLAGTDRRYNLSQIVHVMQTARRRNRFDLSRDLWL